MLLVSILFIYTLVSYNYLFNVLMVFLNLIISNLKVTWFFGYLFLTVLLIFLINSLIFGSVPFIYILGRRMFVMFYISFSSWFIRYLGRWSLNMRFHNVSSLLVIGLFLFDSFVVLLRPITLILRVLINVSLGHFLIIMIHLNSYYYIVIVWLIEFFVYLVQSYVFMTLSKSYLEMIN
jgi:hypothetical protein